VPKGTIKLNIGDPLIFDFKIPKNIENEMKKAISNGYNFYAPSEGVKELREKIAKKEQCKPEDIIVTAGTSEAVNFLFASLVEHGTQILLPSPCYPQYPSLVKLWGGTPIFYDCDENWQPNIHDIKKKIKQSKSWTGNKMKAIVIINPNNPTGVVYDESILREICDIAYENNMIVISDEIYCDLVFGKQFVPTSSVARGPIVTLNGVSKCYLAPGWRIGWMTLQNFKDDILKESILKLCRLRLCANTPAQYAMVKALEDKRHMDKIKAELIARRDFMMKKFEELKSDGININCVKPDGAFYAFPYIEDKKGKWKSDLDMVLKIRDNAHVLVVHGSGFDYHSSPDKKYFRMVFLPPEKILNEAIDRIRNYIKSV
jgi:aspartate/methionine/tyrosine aminotransferase